MNRHKQPRAQQDASIRAVIRAMTPGGYTPVEMNAALDGGLENTRVLMQRLERHGVLKGNGALRGQIFRKTPNWEDRLDEFFATRNANMRAVLARTNQGKACQLEDGPAEPIVSYALRHQPNSVWALGARA